jgi:hypothetical protein
MARPTKQPETKAEPETWAYCLVKTREGWSARTLLFQGERLVGYEDSEPDTRAAATGRIINALSRVE